MRFVIALAFLITFSLTPISTRAQEEILKPAIITPQSSEQIKLSFAPLVKQVAPAIVNIYTKKKVSVRYRSPFAGDPFFSMFFDDRIFGQRMKEKVENSLGSGVILDKNGLIITNAHVIKGADEITIILRDGREFQASLALQDDASDLALLRILNLKEPLPFASLKASESLEVGDLVLAIGNPFGVGQTVTSGIVSAQGRSSLNVNDYNFFIQTDAAINPGNSGGALIDLDGGVVGINTAIYSRDGGSLGIGFAIPSEMVASMIAAEASGQSGTQGIIRPWLGVTGQKLTSDIADSLGLERPNGILIARLHSASPLKKAGMKQGDVITAMNGKALRDPAEMKFRMATIPLGQSATLTFLREDKSKDAKVIAIAPPESPARDTRTLSGNHPLNGATICNINPAVAVELDLKEEETGVVITHIAQRAPAHRISSAGTIIKAINGQSINNTKELEKILKRNTSKNIRKNTHGWELILKKNGRTQRIVLR